jgi:hypothetical protein
MFKDFTGFDGGLKALLYTFKNPGEEIEVLWRGASMVIRFNMLLPIRWEYYVKDTPTLEWKELNKMWNLHDIMNLKIINNEKNNKTN